MHKIQSFLTLLLLFFFTPVAFTVAGERESEISQRLPTQATSESLLNAGSTSRTLDWLPNPTKIMVPLYHKVTAVVCSPMKTLGQAIDSMYSVYSVYASTQHVCGTIDSISEKGMSLKNGIALIMTIRSVDRTVSHVEHFLNGTEQDKKYYFGPFIDRCTKVAIMLFFWQLSRSFQ